MTSDLQSTDPRAVFVVHGRHERARVAMFDFLRALGLQPLEWSFLVRQTGKGSPYVGEVLDTGFKLASAAVILFTPDDEARLRTHFHSVNEPLYETNFTGQSRPNVIFEAGMALGRAPDRTILVEFGVLRPISDLAGRHVIRINNSEWRRQELAERLETAGCVVDISRGDWKTAGDFDAAIRELQGEPSTLSYDLAAEYSVETVEHRERIGSHSFEIDFPQIQGLSESSIQRRINLFFELEFKKLVGLLNDQGEPRRIEYELDREGRSMSSLSFHVGLASPSLLSLYASLDVDCGGAHPSCTGLGFVVDMASGYRYTLHDLFRADLNYQATIKTYIRKAIEREFSDDPFWSGNPPEPDGTVPRPYDFFFGERELTVCNLFSAFALHAVSAQIPYSDLTSIADPRGPLHKLIVSRANALASLAG